MKLYALLAALVLATPALALADERISNLDSLDNEAMRSMAKMFVDAVVDSDPPGFYDMIPAGGLSYFGKNLKKSQAKDKIGKLGIAGFVRMEQSKEEAEAGSPWMFQVQQVNAKSFQIFNGSGYGKTNVAIIARDKDNFFRLTTLKVIDFGPP